MNFVVSFVTALFPVLECGLQRLRVLQVTRDGRTDLFQQRLELAVRGTRNQCLVDRVEHLLVVGHLVINVLPVELGAVQRLEMRRVRRTASRST